MSRKSKAAEFAAVGYNFAITGRGIPVTDAMKNYVMEKISKIERIDNRIIDVTVTMDVQKQINSVDILLKVEHIKIKSHASSLDMYASIDKAMDRLQNQLRKYRDRIRDHHAKGLPITEMNVEILSNLSDSEIELLEIEEEESENDNKYDLIVEYRPHKVLSHEKMTLKTLNRDEAVMKMELSGDSFLLYKSEEDGKLKVIYRRKRDGQYGIIEPQI